MQRPQKRRATKSRKIGKDGLDVSLLDDVWAYQDKSSPDSFQMQTTIVTILIPVT
jgi:hypothetical protein